MVEQNSVDKDITKVESLIETCDELDIDPLNVGPLISSSLKEKLRQEFQELHYLPETATLSFDD